MPIQLKIYGSFFAKLKLYSNFIVKETLIINVL